MPDEKQYVDWDKLPDWVEWIAHHKDGETWMYPKDKEPPIIVKDKGLWKRNGAGRAPDFAVPIDADAIIGPLPPWRESLRKRPAKEGVTQ